MVSPTEAGANGLSQQGDIGFAVVNYAKQGNDITADDFSRLEAAMDPARDAGMQVEFGGEVARAAERPDLGSSEIFGLVAAMVVLLLAFGSVVAMGVPIGTALVGLLIGLSTVTVLTNVFDISSVSTTIATMIGLGVGIDYALFIVTRHREQLATGMTVAESAGHANATAGMAVVFAGTTVVIAICGLAVAGIPMVTTMGFASAIVVAVSVLAAVTLLPALLGLAGTKINSLRLPWVKRKQVEARCTPSGSARGCGPAGLPTSPTVPGGTSSRASSCSSRSRPRPCRCGSARPTPGPCRPTRRNVGPTTSSPTGSARGSTARSSSWPSSLRGATRPPSMRSSPTCRRTPTSPRSRLPASTPTVTPRSSASCPSRHPRTRRRAIWCRRLRGDVIPRATTGTDATVYVGGSTAAFIDISDRIASRLPWFIGAVVALSFLLLMVVFRSILVPLKAAVMNVLSIGAAYGVIVAIFQWGWFRGLFGIEQSLPIVSFIPMMMFAILFGLSMDYEVFLLSRVREEWLRTGDARASVPNGLAATARVITSAALIMICVFLSFVLVDEPTVKMMGIGLATAVFVDATIIRMVLVPATMELLGDANWWLPKWLDRILPHLDLEGGPAPVPEAEEPEGELVGATS